MHHLVTLFSKCFLFGLILGLVPACTVLAETGTGERPASEVRGVWMTTTANDAIASAEQSEQSMRRLREIGINTVYVEAWKNGYTQFPSQVLQDTIGVDRRPALIPADPGDQADRHALPGRDLLGETLIQAHRNGLIYIAWFEYGFMAAHKDTDNHLRRMYPQWMTRTHRGETVSDQNPFVWMNPMRPECQAFLLGIILEAVDKYDLDGVQLDDRIAWPVSMGYDDFTKKVYAQEHNGAQPPDDAHDPDWVAWRAQKVTDFAHRLYTELKEARPNLIVSISPAVYPWSLEHYACDWPSWSQRDWMTEFVPQNYRYDYSSFEKTWKDQVNAMPGMLDRLVAGVLVNGGTRTNPWSDIRRELNLVKDSGSLGHVFWFSPGVLDTYPEEIQTYYADTTPANPHLPADWRPAPIVCVPESQGVFIATIDQPGRYRVIAQRRGVWSKVESRDFSVGEVRLVIPDAGRVELLVDRRAHRPIGS